MKAYGKELILDLYCCDPSLFNRRFLETFCIRLCEEIDMVRGPIFFWDYDTQEEKDAAEDHLCGTSVVQFIETSNITIHCLDRLKTVYINVFSCKDFDAGVTAEFCAGRFKGQINDKTVIERH